VRALVELTGHKAVIERWQELAHRQVAGAAEQHDLKRV
jgi:hypothetical protein